MEGGIHAGKGRAERGCSPMRAILILAVMTALLLAANPVVLAGHGGGELLRGQASARR
jgi:hypothetical protein